jgi:hypothetical protein
MNYINYLGYGFFTYDKAKWCVSHKGYVIEVTKLQRKTGKALARYLIPKSSDIDAADLYIERTDYSTGGTTHIKVLPEALTRHVGKALSVI